MWQHFLQQHLQSNSDENQLHKYDKPNYLLMLAHSPTSVMASTQFSITWQQTMHKILITVKFDAVDISVDSSPAVGTPLLLCLLVSKGLAWSKECRRDTHHKHKSTNAYLGLYLALLSRGAINHIQT